MTEQQLDDLMPALADFLAPYRACCPFAPTFAHFGAYCRGLLSDLPRKTAEPIALAAGTPPRTMQEFLRDHAWDFADARDRLQSDTAAALGALPGDGVGTVGLIDETSAVKKGDKTPGVQRQYLGCVGKVENGVVTVHLGVCKGDFKALIDADLFLPESWADDRKRCREAGVPGALGHRPKWEVALGQLDRAAGNGVEFDWVTFDEEYGKAPGFVAGLDDRKQAFVGEVPATRSCRAAHRSGRRPGPGAGGRPARDVVRSATAFVGQDWRVLRLARRTACEQVWRVKAARVWLSSSAGWSAGTYWLVWASGDETGEEKYFLSNAPADAPVETLVRVAFRRAAVEHGFRVCKSELGLTHFEGRSYTALMRHQVLCLVAMGFAAGRAEALRGGKPGGDGGAGVPGAGGGVPELAAGPARGGGVGVGVTGHRVPPEAEPGGAGVEAEAGRAGSRPEKAAAAAEAEKRAKTKHRPLQVAL